jgi:hypothetical protein
MGKLKGKPDTNHITHQERRVGMFDKQGIFDIILDFDIRGIVERVVGTRTADDR